MNAEECQGVLKYMASVWPHRELDEAQVVVWLETFADVKPAHAREAVRNLKAVKSFMPSHAEFFEAVEIIKRREAAQHEELMLAEPGGDLCLCGNNGWVEVDQIGQGHVIPCDRCNPRRRAHEPDAEHRPNCSCSRCHYGPKRLAAIRAGRDGMAAKKDRTLQNVANQQRVGDLRSQMAGVGMNPADEDF